MIALDATFRDGGYQNNFNFPIDLANHYLKVMEASKIDAIEIGFRYPLEKNVGTFGKVTDEFINENLYIPNVQYFGVMINAADITEDNIKVLFKRKEQSPINMVRVAIHFKDVPRFRFIFDYLKEMGYFVTCNLMQAADKSYDELRDTAELVNSWNNSDILYLADSLGSMSLYNIDYAFEAINEGWKGPTGFHGHNNKGQGLSNSIEALDIGVQWVDGTIMGMGRGAGNTETEYLLNELNKRNYEYELEHIYKLALTYFYPLKQKYNWGPSLPYYLAAEYNIHPTYIQTIMGDTDISMGIMLDILEYLKHFKSNSFNMNLLREAVESARKNMFYSS